MNRLAPLLLAGTLAGTLIVGFTPRAADATSLQMPRANAVVDTDTVRLGDIFDGLEPAMAERTVMVAPMPGRTTVLDAPTLARLAAANGIAWRPVGGADRVEIVRASHEIGAAEIADALKAAAIRAGAPDTIQVTLDNRSLQINLPASAERSFAFDKVQWDAARNRVQAELVAPAPGGKSAPILRQQLGAKAVDNVEIPVLTRRIAPGEIIADADVAYLSLPRDRVNAESVIDAAALVGNTPRRPVAPNMPVRAKDVRSPIVVPKGGVVVISLQTNTMALTAQGRALEDAGLGETVRVMNTTSGRMIEGKVSGPGIIQVDPTGMPLASPHVTKPAKATRTAAR